jgi:signal transduction histidine kinase
MVFTENCTENNSPFDFDFLQCQDMQEEREACWQNLAQRLIFELSATQHKLQQTIAYVEHIDAERKKWAEKLEESEAKNRALTEASVAQAQQFGQTLTQLRQNQAQTIQSEKMASLGQLVAGVAHEINNPVNFVYANLPHAAEYVQDLMRLLQLYQQHYPHPAPEIETMAAEIDLEFLSEDLPKLLMSMRVGAARIQSIVLSLRNFSRLDESEMKEVDIHDGIESTLMILQNRLKAKSNRSEIRVTKNFGQLPLVECYAGQLNQVLMNILANAIDALDERDEKRSFDEQKQHPSTIEITTEVLLNNQIAIRIIDNGLGIPEQIQQRIFDPFFTTKPVGKGTGIGMSISYQIVSVKHQGRLYCNSTVGEGTEFVIEIPIQQQRCGSV